MSSLLDNYNEFFWDQSSLKAPRINSLILQVILNKYREEMK